MVGLGYLRKVICHWPSTFVFRKNFKRMTEILCNQQGFQDSILVQWRPDIRRDIAVCSSFGYNTISVPSIIYFTGHCSWIRNSPILLGSFIIFKNLSSTAIKSFKIFWEKALRLIRITYPNFCTPVYITNGRRLPAFTKWHATFFPSNNKNKFRFRFSRFSKVRNDERRLAGINSVKRCHPYGTIYPTFPGKYPPSCFVLPADWGDIGLYELFGKWDRTKVGARFTANWCILGLSLRVVTSRMKTRFNFTCDLNTCHIHHPRTLLFYTRDQEYSNAICFDTKWEIESFCLIYVAPFRFVFYKFTTIQNLRSYNLKERNIADTWRCRRCILFSATLNETSVIPNEIISYYHLLEATQLGLTLHRITTDNNSLFEAVFPNKLRQLCHPTFSNEKGCSFLWIRTHVCINRCICRASIMGKWVGTWGSHVYEKWNWIKQTVYSVVWNYLAFIWVWICRIT